MTNTPNYRRWLWLSAVIFAVTAYFSLGYNQSDEHFQILEYAAFKMGLNTELDLAWEYGERMRPGLQPGMVVIVQELLAVVGLDNPFAVARIFRFLSAAFSFWITWLLWRTYRSRWTDPHLAWAFFLFSFFLGFSFYNGVRFNSELWSANCFALAIVGQMRWKKPTHWQYLALGGLLGLSFLFRYQVAFMIAGYGLWLLFIKREGWGGVVAFTLGGLAVAALGVPIDRWFYGEWVLSTWHYFEQNILLDKASSFGVDPWWKYFEDMVKKGIPPFSIFYLIATLGYLWLRPRDLITWITIPFLGIHLLIAHKELRFLYVLLPYLPIAMTEVLQWWTTRRGQPLWNSKGYRFSWRFFWVHNALLTLFIAFWPVINEINIYRTIYYEYPEPITVYGLDDHPYRIALYITYYKRANHCLAEVKDIDKLPLQSNETYLFAFDKRKDIDLDDIPGEKRLIYSTFQDWIYHFNFGNWLRRSQWWLVYEVRAVTAER